MRVGSVNVGQYTSVGTNRTLVHNIMIGNMPMVNKFSFAFWASTCMHNATIRVGTEASHSTAATDHVEDYAGGKRIPSCSRPMWFAHREVIVQHSNSRSRSVLTTAGRPGLLYQKYNQRLRLPVRSPQDQSSSRQQRPAMHCIASPEE